MLSRDDDTNFACGPEGASHQMYSQELYGFESMQSYMDSQDFGHPRTTQDLYPSFSSFASGPTYSDMSQPFIGEKQSPHLYPTESPELRAPPSNLSTASGPSASSSTIGSPYSTHGQTVPVPEWNTSGLGINPSIVSFDNSFAQDINYTAPGMEHEIAFPDANKSSVFVGECANVSASSSSMSTFVPSNQMDMIENTFDRKSSAASTLRSAPSPMSSIAPPSAGNDFVFKSPSTPASSTSPESMRRCSVFSLGNSSAAGRAQDCRSSPMFSSGQSFKPDAVEQPSYNTYRQSPFFSQTSGQFVAPLESSCVFFLCRFLTRLFLVITPDAMKSC